MPEARPTTSRVCVLLPVHRDAATLAGAFSSIQAQTLRDWHCLVLVNGADEATLRLAHALAAGEPRAELVMLREAGLARALNAGLRRASELGVELCARMDADDWSMPQRLDVQVGAIAQSRVAALACDWEVWDSSLQRLERVVRVPTDAQQGRWRMLLENPYAHGAMLLRTRAILEAGGYDQSMDKAQDYDLWLRLCARQDAIGGVGQVLYRHRAKDATRGAGVLEQARFAARARVRAWARLPFDDGEELCELLARVQAGELGRESGLRALEAMLRERGPTREGMMAWMQLSMLAHGEAAGAGVDGDDAFVRQLAVLARNLAAEAQRPVYLFPGGRVARRALREEGLLGVVAGVVDDSPERVRRLLAEMGGEGDAGESIAVLEPAEVPAEAIVLLASHAHAEQLWEASARMRARGIVVRSVGEQMPGAERGTERVNAWAEPKG
jgi:hypothetical protein